MTVTAPSGFRAAGIAAGIKTTGALDMAMVVNDGESNWVEGLQLLSVYLVLALAFYFVPA